LGASEIIFLNPLFSEFFRRGQVLETFRGRGIYQPAVDFAIDRLDQGGWVHLFGEGKINPPSDYVQDATGKVTMPRFRWGVGRMLMDTKVPVVIPIWLTGFDNLMPVNRPAPYKYFPRLGVELSVTVGEPIPSSHLTEALAPLDNLRIPPRPLHMGAEGTVSKDEATKGWMGEQVKQKLSPIHEKSEAERTVLRAMDDVRSRVTAIVQEHVEQLGREVSGHRLGKPQ